MGPQLLARPAKVDNARLASLLEPSSKQNAAATKVIATVGPGCRDEAKLAKMLEAGMSAARFDLAWGPLDYHLESARMVRQAMKRSHRICAMCLDLSGRTCRVAQQYTFDGSGFPVFERTIRLKAKQPVVVTSRTVEMHIPEDSTQTATLPVSRSALVSEAFVGDQIELGRYLTCDEETESVRLKVESVNGEELMCRALNDLQVRGHLTVTLCRDPNRLPKARSGWNTAVEPVGPVLDSTDREAMQAFHKAGLLDVLFVGDVTGAEDLIQVREELDKMGATATRIVVKIKSASNVINFGMIALHADGVLLSRGWLGLAVTPERIPMLQKRLVQCCNILGRVCIVSRIVDSMSESPRPTRAEATDIANSVIDGVDGMLLGAQTLRGAYPLESVRTVVSICREAERTYDIDALHEQIRASFLEDLVPGHHQHVGGTPPAWMTEQMKSTRSMFFYGNEPPSSGVSPCASLPNLSGLDRAKSHPSSTGGAAGSGTPPQLPPQPAPAASNSAPATRLRSGLANAYSATSRSADESAVHGSALSSIREVPNVREPAPAAAAAVAPQALPQRAVLQQRESAQPEELRHEISVSGMLNASVEHRASVGHSNLVRLPQIEQPNLSPPQSKNGNSTNGHAANGHQELISVHEPPSILQEMELTLGHHRKQPQHSSAGKVAVVGASGRPLRSARGRHQPVDSCSSAEDDSDDTAAHNGNNGKFQVAAPRQAHEVISVVGAGGMRPAASWGSLAVINTSPAPSPYASMSNLQAMHSASHHNLSAGAKPVPTDLSAAAAAALPTGAFLALTHAEVSAANAVDLARQARARLLIVVTDSGKTTALVAKYKPDVPIMSLVVPCVETSALLWRINGLTVARQCALLRGVTPVLASATEHPAGLLAFGIQHAYERGQVDLKDRIVAISRVGGVFTGPSVQLMTVEGALQGSSMDGSLDTKTSAVLA